MPKIRTTMRPFEEIEVSELEAEDLRRQGLVQSEVDPAAEAAKVAPPKVKE